MCRPLFARTRALPFWIAILTFALTFPTLAQTDVTTSRVSGTVRAADNSPLPGVTVEAKNDSTGLVVTTVSRGDGFYRLHQFTSGVCL
jgi:hypothetical protein